MFQNDRSKALLELFGRVFNVMGKSKHGHSWVTAPPIWG